MTKARPKPQRGRPPIRGERRVIGLNFKTTLTIKRQAEQLAAAENRSIASLIEMLIRSRWEGILGRAPYQAAAPMMNDIA